MGQSLQPPQRAHDAPTIFTEPYDPLRELGATDEKARAAAVATIIAPQTGSNPLNSDKECMRHAAECVRLAGLTDDLNVRDQLVELAQGWIAAAQRERPRSGDEP